MSYIKTNWVDKTPTNSGTPINAANMNKIEQGIEDVDLQTEQHITDSDIHVLPSDKTEWNKISEMYGGEISVAELDITFDEKMYKVVGTGTVSRIGYLWASPTYIAGALRFCHQLFLYPTSNSLRQRTWDSQGGEDGEGAWRAWESYAYTSDLLPILQDIVELQEKKLNRQDAPNAIIGTASGQSVTLTDVQEGTEARNLKIYGETTEIGEGEKSPDNPYELVGVENATVTVHGKNLFYAISGNSVTNHGMTRTYDLEKQTMTIDGTATRESGHINVLTTNFKFKAGKSYKLRAFIVGGTGGQTVTVSKGDGKNGVINLYVANNYTATYIPEVDSVGDVTAGFYWFNGTTADNFTVKLMISEVDVDEYEPYKPTVEYPLSFDPSLYEGDSYDLTADQAVPLHSPTSIISTDQGSLEVEYNRDINKVLADMQAQINALTALGGTIDV